MSSTLVQPGTNLVVNDFESAFYVCVCVCVCVWGGGGGRVSMQHSIVSRSYYIFPGHLCGDTVVQCAEGSVLPAKEASQREGHQDGSHQPEIPQTNARVPCELQVVAHYWRVCF